MFRKVLFSTILPCLVFLVGPDVCADEKAYPQSFKLMHYDEDYSYLKNKKNRNFWEDLKYIEIKDLANSYLSIGGEVRERYQNFQHYHFDLEKYHYDGYLLHRALLHADWHMSEYFRAYVEFGNFYAVGKKNPKLTVEEDRLDLQQGFAEIMLPINDNKLFIRGGRQEMVFGSYRLLASLNFPNVLRRFDGLRIGFKSKEVNVDGFYTSPTVPKVDVFDDHGDNQRSFWGTYAVFNNPAYTVKANPVFASAPNVDLYYLGLDNSQTVYTQGTAFEHRQTVGTRLWRNNLRALDYNFEFNYQFGRFGADNISAWSAASDTGYRFYNLPLKPRFALKADVFSGDNNLKDHTLGTFNALYPDLTYYSQHAMIVPANLFNIFPYVDVNLTKQFNMKLGYDMFWRHSKQDALYINPVHAMPGSAASNSRFVGSEITMDLNWQVNHFIQLNGSYVHFFKGDVVKSAGGTDVDFFRVSADFMF